MSGNKKNYSQITEKIAEWTKIQDELKSQIQHHDGTQLANDGHVDFKNLKYIAGVDISVPKEAHSDHESVAVTALVILDMNSQEIVNEQVEIVHLEHPYIPGFLAFREAPSIVNLIQKTISKYPAFKPDVILVDGNGQLHPQRCGLACHIGLKTNIPTVGVAKNLFHIDGLIIPEKSALYSLPKKSDSILLKTTSNEILGIALKTTDESQRPVYLSIGHKISLETAKNIVLAVSKYRIPEPIRIADRISRELIRKEFPNVVHSLEASLDDDN